MAEPAASGATPKTIDLNCDLGEGGRHDAELLTLVSSANIACGGHAGDDLSMRATIAAAQARGVALGAHPGLVDGAGGRGDQPPAISDAFDAVLEQIRALQAIAAPAALTHVKPHGTLYNLAALDGDLAMAVAAAIFSADPNLIVYGLAGGKLLAAATEIGLATAAEGFADRGILHDGRLIPRSQPGALITDPALAAAQAVHLTTRGGQAVTTLCVHGDTPGAPAIARAVRAALEQAGFRIAPPTPLPPAARRPAIAAPGGEAGTEAKPRDLPSADATTDDDDFAADDPPGDAAP